jgi:hypothetical protein
MKTKNRKILNSLSQLPKETEKGIESSARLPWDYSPPTLSVEGAELYQKIYSTDVNLTIRLKVKEFTRKQACLIVGQSVYEVVHEGIGLGDWMTLEFLYSYLLGNKIEPLRVKNPKELELLLLLKIILLSGTFLGLEDKVQLPEDIKKLCLLSKWIPNKRTYYSRKNQYRLNKFLSVRIVPIENLIERSKDSVRYSSYCKGYGESSHMGRRQKTRPSSELDGEQVDLEKERSTKIPLYLYQFLFDLNLLELKYQPKRK